MGKKKIEIMDTTLRDGEQTSGVSFSLSEKLTITQLLLEELRVDRVEVASARVSDGEFASVKAIMDWALKHGHPEKIEVLSFVDQGVSIEWMSKAGVKVQNLLTKGSLNHLKHQLKKTPEQHFTEIAELFKLASKHGFSSNVYLEDWSNGMRNSPEYVYQYLDLPPFTIGNGTVKVQITYLGRFAWSWAWSTKTIHCDDLDVLGNHVWYSVEDDNHSYKNRKLRLFWVVIQQMDWF
jgi:isopropylmalate/homocitrate/citramalate synthase